MVCFNGVLMVWFVGGVLLLWYDVLVSYGVMWCGIILVWWFGGMVLVWCHGIGDVVLWY